MPVTGVGHTLGHDGLRHRSRHRVRAVEPGPAHRRAVARRRGCRVVRGRRRRGGARLASAAPAGACRWYASRACLDGRAWRRPGSPEPQRLSPPTTRTCEPRYRAARRRPSAGDGRGRPPRSSSGSRTRALRGSSPRRCLPRVCCRCRRRPARASSRAASSRRCCTPSPFARGAAGDRRRRQGSHAVQLRQRLR